MLYVSKFVSLPGLKKWSHALKIIMLKIGIDLLSGEISMICLFFLGGN